MSIHLIEFNSFSPQQNIIIGGICAFPDFLGTFLLFFPNIVNVAYVDNFNLIT